MHDYQLIKIEYSNGMSDQDYMVHSEILQDCWDQLVVEVIPVGGDPDKSPHIMIPWTSILRLTIYPTVKGGSDEASK